MVDYAYAHLFEEDNVEKQWIIDYGDGLITNENLDTQSIELTESLCSESELKFGCCESSCLKFKCSDVAVSLTGKWITASIVLDSHEDAPFVVGTYKVESDKLTADRMHREVVAYDAMRDIINSSMIEWYNSVFPSGNERVPMHSFRQKFADHFGLEQAGAVGNVLEDGTLSLDLVNDRVYLSKTIQVGEGTETDNGTEQVSILKESSLSGLDVISAICEINGCFCHINRKGELEYVYLKQDTMGLYPSETLYPGHAPDYLPQAKTLNLYPQEPDSFEIKRSCCASCKYEDYLVKPITKLQIRQNEDDVGCVYPEGEISKDDNCYIIEDNFLVYGKGAEELAQIAANIFRKITDIIYRPFSAEVRGNPCVETGDAIRISTKYDIIESYVLNRTMKGGHGLMGSISSQGAERYAEKANSVSRSIIQLKGKTNTLIRNVDETRSELESFEVDANGKIDVLSSSITQTAERIELEVTERKDGQEDLSSRISQTIDTIDLSVENGDKQAGIKITLKKEGDETPTTKEAVGKIDLTGLVSFGNLEKSGETTIDGGNIKTDSIDASKIKVGTLYLVDELRIKRLDSDGNIRERVALWMEDVEGQTDPNVIVGGKNWSTNVVIKDSLDCLSQANFGANVTMEKTLDVFGDISTRRYVYLDEMGVKRGVAVWNKAGTSRNGELIAGIDADDVTTLIGTPANADAKTKTLLRGNEVKIASSGATVTSDERLKNSFKPLDEFDGVYMDIEPCAFKYNNGTSGRFHFGVKAQNVKEAFESHGYTTQDFGGFVQMSDSPENEDYCGVDDPMGLIYTEFTMWNMHMVQELYKKVGKQQEEIANLKETISSLLGKDVNHEQGI